MFCPTCGNEIREGSQFCPKCGAPVHGEITQRAQGKPVRKGASKALVPIIIALLLAVGIFFVVKVVLPRLGGGSSTPEAVSSRMDESSAAHSDGDEAGPQAESADSTGSRSGTIGESMWDVGGVSLTDVSLERDQYDRIVAHATATNNMSVDAVCRLKAEIELANLSERFKSTQEQREPSGDWYVGTVDVAAITKEDSDTPSISETVLRLAPHESTRIAALLEFREGPFEWEDYDFVYGTDYQFSLTGFQPVSIYQHAESVLGWSLASRESDRDNDAIFAQCLQDMTCEIVSTDVQTTKERGSYDTTTVVRLRNNGSERHGVCIILGCFDKDGNLLGFSSATVRDRGRQYLYSVTREGESVSVTKGDGGLNWNASHTVGSTDMCFGGEVEPGAEIEVTATFSTYGFETELSPDSPIRIVGMVPIAKDLSIEGLS